jgi:hypothetical protein
MESKFCSACGTALLPDARGGLRCAGCGAVIAEPLTLCPRCGHLNETGTAACARCDSELTAACPACGYINWSGTERCVRCGRELDALAHAFRPVGASVEIRRQELLQRVSTLREKEEQESRARLETLREADRRRMQRESKRAADAEIRRRRIVIGAAAAVIIFVVLAVLALMSRFRLPSAEGPGAGCKYPAACHAFSFDSRCRIRGRLRSS